MLLILYVGLNILLIRADRLIELVGWFDCLNGGEDGMIYEDDVNADGHHEGQHALSPPAGN